MPSPPEDLSTPAAADPFGFRQFDTDDEGEDVRYAAVGQLSAPFTGAKADGIQFASGRVSRRHARSRPW